MKPQLGLIVITVLVLTACDPLTSSTNTTDDTPLTVIKIGSANPLSGPLAHLGHDSDNGVRLAIMEANQEKLMLDDKPVTFQVISEDDQGDPERATLVAQHLIDNKVVGIIGHYSSGASIPAARLYSEAGVPMISGSATNPTLTAQGYKNIFRMIANDKQQSHVLAQYAMDQLKLKRVAIVDDRSTYGAGLAGNFSRAFTAIKGEVVQHESTPNTATNFTEIIMSLKVSKPDLVFFGGMDTQGAELLKQMRKQGVEAKFMGADGIYSPEFVKLGGASTEGTYASMPGIPLAKLPGYALFSSKYKQEFNIDIQNFAPYTYDATKIMIEAMKRAGSAEPSKYLPELANIEYTGVTGPISFDEKGDINNATVSLYQLKNGKWEGL